MRHTLMKSLVGGAVIAVVAATALAPSAKAECWSNGYGWSCAPGPQTAYYHPEWQTPIPVPGPGWGYNYGNYNQIQNDYPGPALTGENQ